MPGVSSTYVRVAEGKAFDFRPALDEGIREAVMCLIRNGIETFESCEGGPGHCFPEPTIRFEGDAPEGFRALSVALSFGLPVFRLRRTWGVSEGYPHGPWWEMTFRANVPLQPRAMLTEPVAASAVPAFVTGNVSARRAVTVVVVDAVGGWLSSLVDRMKGRDSRHV
jgi:hypothetical protein